MDIAALETFARDLDISNCSKPELRRLVAVASSIAARGRAEIEAQPCTFPARLAPLVTQWLPLSDVGAALSCSGQWRDTSEWAFQLVAERIGLPREPGVSWRETVQYRLRWIGEAREPGSVEVELARVHLTRGALTCTAPGYGSGDDYFVGSGFQISEDGARTAEWRVRMRRDDTTDPIDACGFALLDSTRSQILLSYHWNSDGQEYEGDEYRTPWMRERRVHDDDNDDKDIFGTEATLQVTVHPEWNQHRREDSDQVTNTLMLFVYLYLVESDGSLTRLSAFNHNVTSFYYSDQLDDFYRRCGRPNHQWDSEEVCDLCVVPFVRLFEESTATLSRVPAGPDATGSDDE